MKDTFIMIKPDAMERGLQGEIQLHLVAHGFEIVEARSRPLQEREACFLYLEHSEKDFFRDLVAYTLSDRVQLLWLRATEDSDNGPELGRQLLTYLRKTYGQDKRRNSVHASDSDSAAERELSYFFNWRPE